MQMQQRVPLNEAAVIAGVPFLIAVAERESFVFIAALAVTTVLYALLGWYLHPVASGCSRRLVLLLMPPVLLALAGLATRTYVAFGPVFLYFSLGHLRMTYSGSARPIPTGYRLLLAIVPGMLMLICLALLYRSVGAMIGHAIFWLVTRS